jgi:hypothetical protein
MRYLAFSFLIALFLSAGTRAGATVLVPIEFRELVASAAIIVHGRVADVHTEWVDGRRAVETVVTVDAAEYLKGSDASEITFKVPGGQLGRYRTVFVGAPTFERGQEVILFLKSDGSSMPFVVGLSQGVFHVVTDARSGRRLVTPPIVMAKPGVDAEPIVRGDPARRDMSVEAFRDTVRQVLSETTRGGVR